MNKSINPTVFWEIIHETDLPFPQEDCPNIKISWQCCIEDFTEYKSQHYGDYYKVICELLKLSKPMPSPGTVEVLEHQQDRYQERALKEFLKGFMVGGKFVWCNRRMIKSFVKCPSKGQYISTLPQLSATHTFQPTRLKSTSSNCTDLPVLSTMLNQEQVTVLALQAIDNGVSERRTALDYGVLRTTL